MKNSVAYFWKWFSENRFHFNNPAALAKKDLQQYHFWLKWHLKFYARGLDCIIKYPNNNGDPIELIITAHGQEHLFEAVHNAIKLAPRIRGWKFTAFIPPIQDLNTIAKGLDKPYQFAGMKIKISELRFTPVPDPPINKIHLIIHFANLHLYADNIYLLDLILMMLQDLLGEKSFYRNIDVVDFSFEYEEDEDFTIPLFQLQAYIEFQKRV